MQLDPSPLSREGMLSVARSQRVRRHEIARTLADAHDGVVTRADLRAAGVTREQIRAEVERGVWHRAGWHTLSIDGVEPRGRGLWWRALWESGRHAVLDGATALQASGLTGWREDVIHISVPSDGRPRPLAGVQHHHLRWIGGTTGGELRRTRPAVATVRAAQWAATDRQAATLVAMSVQQRLARPDDVLAHWQSFLHTNRRTLLDAVIRDVCDGAHSMSELDFAQMCRDRGLPEPSRQVVRTGARGRVYLDVHWEELGIHVEIQGAQHDSALAIVDDALRFNSLRLDGDISSFQVPVLGLRLCPDKFLDQIEQAIQREVTRRRVA